MGIREDLNTRLEELRGGIEYLAAFEDLDDTQRSQWDEAVVEFDELKVRIADIKDREDRAADAAKVPSLQIIQKVDPVEVLNDRGASPQQLADAATRNIEQHGTDPDGLAGARVLLNRHKGDIGWARDMAHRSTPTYTDAFLKLMTGREASLTSEERAAMAVGTNTQGGVRVPTHLDPTIIITNSGASNVIRGISRVETLTVGNVWNGVSSAGVTSSWDGELVETSDDTPNDFARVSVPLYKAATFAQASEEALQDIANVQQNLLTMFADSKDRLEAAAHATGSGSSQPTGIFTALDANTNVELLTTTAATLDLTQVQRTYRAVPVRWRGSSSWLIHPLFLGTIQALGSTVGASYSTDITQSYTARLLGRPVVESDEAPSTETTTAKDNLLILGDFSNFLIIDKPGSMTSQFIPVLFNTTTNLPDGRVGWRVAWRTGSDSINDLGFRLLQDKTSA